MCSSRFGCSLKVVLKLGSYLVLLDLSICEVKLLVGCRVMVLLGLLIMFRLLCSFIECILVCILCMLMLLVIGRLNYLVL